MDLEAVQSLNLSPIPELSEIELSTMLEQLSGLSDLNADLTDRNIEDILKEAENLIDTSISSKIDELPISVVEHDKQVELSNTDSKKVNEAQESLSDAKNSSSPAENVTPKSSPTKTSDISKHYNSPAEQSNKILSPEGLSNPIKTTIDSLREYSLLVEKQLNSRSTKPPKQNQGYNDEVKDLNKSVRGVTSPKSVLKNTKQKTSPVVKNSESVKINNSGKLINCFERLYQERPNRISKKPKSIDKMPKTVIKKKDVKNFKSHLSKTGKTTWRNNKSEEFKNKVNEKGYLEVENWLKSSNSNYSIQNNYMFDIPPKRVEDESENECTTHKPRSLSEDFRGDDSSKISSQIDEKLILKLLLGMEEIKDHVKKAGITKTEVPEKLAQESQAVIDNLRLEVESVKEKVIAESVKNEGIQRLEEQFAILKDKYDQHMNKLEAENLKLREALSAKYNTKRNTCNESASNFEIGPFAERQFSVSQNFEKISRSFSLENCRAPRNSPSSSAEDIRSTACKEAFSQTEKEVRNMSIQCLDEKVIIEEEDQRKTENKENVTERKKLGKERPFSEKNAQQLLKQKKIISGHESELLATLRGLQVEITKKEKENRKLKTEIDLLKSQVKKSGKRIEGCKRRHIGTQTIGLGPATQKPYDPEIYEVPKAFEIEKDELNSKIKALEKDFELLKEKRIHDLQALHQVHEEEMAKLLSKLETQSALTKHLHTLLVNR